MVSTRDALNADGKANKDARRSIYEFVGQVYQHCDLDGDGVLSEREVEFGQFLVGSEVAAARQALRGAAASLIWRTPGVCLCVAER